MPARARPRRALERVQPDVVVIAARRQEGQLITDPAGDLEAEDVAVEGDGAVEVGHLEVDMADLGAGIDRVSCRQLSRAPRTPGIGATPKPDPRT